MRRHAKAPSAFTFGRSALLGLLAFTTLLAIAPAAKASLAVDTFFGNPTSSTGNTGGLFNQPRGVAVNDSTGAIYVVDGSNNRIQQFDQNNNFVRAWGRDVILAGKPNDNGTLFEICDTSAGNVAADCKAGITSPGALGGTMSSPEGIAVNQETGHVYVTDRAFIRVQEFTATGTFVRAWGAGVVDGGATGTGNVTNASTSVSSWTSLTKVFVAGQTIAGEGIQPNTIITAISATTITLSKPATETKAGVALTVAPGAGNVPVNEVQTVTLPAKANGGTFSLIWNPGTGNQTAAGIPFNASPLQVQTALEGLAALNPGDVVVTSPNPGGGSVPGGPYTVEFTGARADADVATMTNVSTLTVSEGSTSISIATVAIGASGAEICINAAECKTGVAGMLGGAFGSASAGNGGYPAVIPAGAPSAGDVIVADSANRRIQQFTASGVFVRAFGTDVEMPTAPEDDSPTEEDFPFEICAVAANCKAGTLGIPKNIGEQLPGAFVGQSHPQRVEVDKLGAIYALRPAEALSPERINKFTPQGPSQLSPSFFAPDALISKGVEQTISALAVDSLTGHIYVARTAHGFATQASCPGPLVPSARQILEFDPAGNLVDTRLQCSRINSLNALAIRPSTGDLYFSSQSHVPIAASVSTNRHGVYVMRTTVQPPVAEVDPPTGVSTFGATFSGKVNPMGHETFYQYEYKLASVPDEPWNWTKAPTALPSAGSGNALVPAASQAVTGLKPEQAYEVRLAAHKIYGAGSDRSDPINFVTAPGGPEVQEDLLAFQAGPDSVRLVGRIKPGFGQVSYEFRYGPNGNLTEKASGEIPGGPEATNHPVQVSKLIAGLQKGTPYSFTLAATSSGGSDEANVAEFELGDQTPIDNRPRVYERVSPGDKNGGNVYDTIEESPGPSGSLANIGHAVSTDGNAAVFRSYDSFAGLPYPVGQKGVDYVSRRTPSGWIARGAMPFTDLEGGEPFDFANAPTIALWSADLARMAFVTNKLLTTDAEDLNPSGGPRIMYVTKPDGSPVWLYSRPNSQVGPETRAETAWGTPELDRIAIHTSRELTDTPDALGPTIGKVYEWSEAGGYELASVMPNGEPAQQEARTGSAFWPNSSVGSSGTRGGSIHRSMSVDGEHIFFSTPAAAVPPDSAKIYRRSHGTETKLVSPSQLPGGDPQGEKAKLYITATPDQSEDGPAAVFFTSKEQLTTDSNTGPARAGNELYRYEVNSDELTAISATPGGDGARAQGLLDVSDDGKWVYYVGLGEVVPGKGTAGQPNLYLWHDDGSAGGATTFIATLDPTDSKNYDHDSEHDGAYREGPERRRVSRVSRDGQRLLFESTEQLTSYDNQGLTQLYLYDVGGSAGAGQIACVSCDPSGTPATVATRAPTLGTNRNGASDPTRILSDDGRRVFFESKVDLLAADANGKVDIYQWQDGELSLISSGKGTRDVLWTGASRSGDDVFFITYDQLDAGGLDVDGSSDLYDARVGGGFPQAPPAPPCTGEDCKAVATPQPDASSPASSDFTGQGNSSTRSSQGRKCGKGTRKVKRRGQVRCQRVRSKGNRQGKRSQRQATAQGRGE